MENAKIPARPPEGSWHSATQIHRGEAFCDPWRDLSSPVTFADSTRGKCEYQPPPAPEGSWHCATHTRPGGVSWNLNRLAIFTNSTIGKCEEYPSPAPDGSWRWAAFPSRTPPVPGQHVIQLVLPEFAEAPPWRGQTCRGREQRGTSRASEETTFSTLPSTRPQASLLRKAYLQMVISPMTAIQRRLSGGTTPESLAKSGAPCRARRTQRRRDGRYHGGPALFLHVPGGRNPPTARAADSSLVRSEAP